MLPESFARSDLARGQTDADILALVRDEPDTRTRLEIAFAIHHARRFDRYADVACGFR